MIFADELAGGFFRKKPAKEADTVSHMRGKNAAERYDPNRGIEREGSQQDTQHLPVFTPAALQHAWESGQIYA